MGPYSSVDYEVLGSREDVHCVECGQEEKGYADANRYYWPIELVRKAFQILVVQHDICHTAGLSPCFTSDIKEIRFGMLMQRQDYPKRCQSATRRFGARKAVKVKRQNHRNCCR